MIIPPAEKRKCDQCLISMNLNLFRLNSSICRFCQDGMTIPKSLVLNDLLEHQEKAKEIDIDNLSISLELEENRNTHLQTMLNEEEGDKNEASEHIQLDLDSELDNVQEIDSDSVN